MIGLSTSLGSSTDRSWYWIHFDAAWAVGVLSTALLAAFHAYRLIGLWRLLRSRHWLILFHLLLFTGYLSFLPYLIWSLACNIDRLKWPICNYETSASARSNAPIILLGTFLNLANFCFNAAYALLGFYARKEIVYARDGPSRWHATYKPMMLLTTVCIVSGLLFFLQVDPAESSTWSRTQIISWTGTLVQVVTTLASTITVGVLTALLNFSQRVLPFMSTKLLLLAVFLAFGAFLFGAIANIPELANYDLLQDCLVWAQVLPFHLSNFLIAFLFRHNPNEYQSLDTLVSEADRE